MIDFGEVRSLAHQPPSAQAWAELSALLEQAPQAQARQLLLPYLSRQLERWPDALLEAPLEWLARALSGHEVPLLALARTLDAELLTPQELIELAQRGLLDGLRALRVQAHGPRVATLHEVLKAAPALRLHTLELRGPLPEDALRGLVAHPTAPRLRTLSVQGAALGLRVAQRLGHSPALRGLERLTLRDAQLDAPMAQALAKAAHLPNLRALSLSGSSFAPGAMRELLSCGELTTRLSELDLSHITLETPSELDLSTARRDALRVLELSGSPMRDVILHDDGWGRAWGRAWGSIWDEPRGVTLDPQTLPNLERLHLRAMVDADMTQLTRRMRSRRARALGAAQGPFLALKVLDLRQNWLSLEQVQALCQEPLSLALEALWLDLEALGATGARWLSSCATLPPKVRASWAAQAACA